MLIPFQYKYTSKYVKLNIAYQQLQINFLEKRKPNVGTTVGSIYALYTMFSLSFDSIFNNNNEKKNYSFFLLSLLFLGKFRLFAEAFVI